MKISEFITKFSNEKTCKEYYRDLRMREGVVCKKCGCKKHYWLQGKWQFQCSSCGFRTTLKSGTVMENSRLSFQKWFLIMMLMTGTKKGVSACEMQRQVGHKHYKTIWSIMHRLRDVMGKRDDLYQLTDMVEFDEGHFPVETAQKVRNDLKRGKGSQRQRNVAVMAESVYLEDVETGKISKHCRYFKMKVLEDHKSNSAEEAVKSSLDSQTIVFSDKSTSYFNFSEHVDVHMMEKSSKETTVTTLRWVHIAISNAKRNFLGVYHKIKGKYLQNYLNEFVYKLNRRYFKSIFTRLLVASVFPYWHTSS
jgi:transposase-like protein